MKKQTILMIMLALTTVMQRAAAQSFLSVGPAAALGASWVSHTPGGNPDLKFSPALGIGVLYSRAAHWGFGGELLLSHEGYKAGYTTPDDFAQTMTVNPVYLSLPLHVTYFFGKTGSIIRPKIYLGPTVAMRVDERRFYSTAVPVYSIGQATDNTQFRRFDAGVNGGLGANIRLAKKTWLDVDAGYYRGLMDAIVNTSENSAYNANNNLRLHVGLMFGL